MANLDQILSNPILANLLQAIEDPTESLISKEQFRGGGSLEGFGPNQIQRSLDDPSSNRPPPFSTSTSTPGLSFIREAIQSTETPANVGMNSGMLMGALMGMIKKGSKNKSGNYASISLDDAISKVRSQLPTEEIYRGGGRLPIHIQGQNFRYMGMKEKDILNDLLEFKLKNTDLNKALSTTRDDVIQLTQKASRWATRPKRPLPTRRPGRERVEKHMRLMSKEAGKENLVNKVNAARRLNLNPRFSNTIINDINSKKKNKILHLIENLRQRRIE